MNSIKVGDKLRFKKEFVATFAPNGKYSIGDIIQIDDIISHTHGYYISFKKDNINNTEDKWCLNSEYFESVIEEKPMTPCEKLGYKFGDAFIAPYDKLSVKKKKRRYYLSSRR